ncbi:glycosyltransferase family protein [Mucilaginibacter pedocola]|uniref:Glycosyltransferase subfamily 4-like N-terminal domain-containing protein n=1 Tax=Mucilaginibacter pedocola TaxID=1792845 RepID=A0A1S9P7Y1_9SPHI|nr:glycosyltransferase [Mucilaginibacter pedocola]OOQ57070.1 hypothetical protein BC343_16190 [Mucilaginibacter pedocola]
MKLLTYQPFSLYSNGGGNRILRRLFKGHEADVASLLVEENPLHPREGAIHETIVYATPIVRKWARWKLRNFRTWLRHGLYKVSTIKKVQQAARSIPYDVLHVVDHGPYSAALCTDEFCGDKPLWVSFHDHFSTTYGLRENSEVLWKRANRRLVISEEIGEEYGRLFGKADYELITDGVAAAEVSEPLATTTEPIAVYFAGLLHLEYIPLFKVLADALDILSKQGKQFKLILRATQYMPFLENRAFATDYRPMTLNDAELKGELDSSAILYLPIKFTKPDFYLYSLSTKMVGYLGGAGAILYHGPDDSAACNLLRKNQAAVSCGNLDAEKLSADILALLTNKQSISAQAKILAKAQFEMADIQSRFWQQ